MELQRQQASVRPLKSAEATEAAASVSTFATLQTVAAKQ